MKSRSGYTLKGEEMYLFWRVQQDLNCMGEFLIFLDPSLNRSFRDWVRKNAGGLAYAEDWAEEHIH